MAPDDKTRFFLDWLSPISFLSEHEESSSQAIEGSYQWVLESEAWKEWISGKKQTIWLHGPPGCGKTVACSILIDTLSRQIASKPKGPAPEGIAYCYCTDVLHSFSANTGVQLQPVDLIRNIFKQLYQAVPVDSTPNTLRSDMIREFKSRLTSLEKPTPLGLKECLQALCSVAKYFSRVYIIIDTLDLCSNPDELLTHLRKVQQAGKNISLLITSTHEDPSTRFLEKQVELRLRASEQDIRTYVTQAMNHPNLRRIVEREPKLGTEITDYVVQGAHGIFMLPLLQINQLCNQYCPRNVHDLLNSPDFILPEGMPSFLDKVIQRIQTQPRERALLAFNVLAWVTYAKTPLTVPELHHALAIRKDDDHLQLNGAPETCDILSACGGLVTVQEINNNGVKTFQLCHPMLQVYFQKKPGILAAAQKSIPVTCLTYLNIGFAGVAGTTLDAAVDPNETEPGSGIEALTALKVAYPLLEYACKFWAIHARENVDGSFWNVVSKYFLDNPLRVWLCILVGEHTTSIPDFKLEKGTPQISPLYMAVLFNLPSVLAILVRSRGEDQSLFTPATDGNTLCSWAAYNDHLEVLKCLVATEVDLQLDKGGTTGKSAMFHAAEQGSLRVLRFLHQLRQQGVVFDTNLADSEGETPITAAGKNKQFRCVEILVKQFGIPIDTRGASGATPVYYAARGGFTEFVKFLIVSGADLKLVKSDDDSPLSAAIRGGHEETVSILLEGLFLQEGSRAIIESAMERCIRESATRNDTTILNYLFQIREQLDKMMLKRLRAEGKHEFPASFPNLFHLVHSIDDIGRSPISYAAELGNKEVVEVLLKEGAWISNLDTARHWSPLHYAVLEGDIEVLRMMLSALSENHLYFHPPQGSNTINGRDAWLWDMPRDGTDTCVSKIQSLIGDLGLLIERQQFVNKQKSRPLSRHPAGIISCAELLKGTLPGSAAVATLLRDIFHHILWEIIGGDKRRNEELEKTITPNRQTGKYGASKDGETQKNPARIARVWWPDSRKVLRVEVIANGSRVNFDIQ